MSDTIIINHGPNFRGVISFFGIFLAITGIFILIFNFDLSEFNSVAETIGHACLVILGFNIFLGFEGVQFDLRRKKVREYYSLMGMRLGVWHSLSDYDLLLLTIDRFSVLSSTPYTMGRRTMHKTFDVMLVRDKNERGMLLEECKNYNEGKKKLTELASKLDFPARDKCLEEMAKSKERRQGRRRR